ncbi:MAG: hypothetical protein GKR89_13100 [Candidatus Latescibacteria bacterium]|nr:hypothetical protein [Candidatus Latescibacterota bacterium]
MASRKLGLGAAQIGTGDDIAANLDKIVAAMRRAAREGCQILLFHEGCLTGYPDRAQVARLDFARVAAAEEKVVKLARRLGLAVLLGSTSQGGGQVFNDVLIVDESGQVLGRYAKTWRAGEPWYAAGSGPVIFRVCGVDATVLICHDLRYPELVRLGVAAGARIVFIANNESGLSAENKLLGYRSMQISRATENLVYTVMANAPEDPADFGRAGSSHGNSKIVDPLGNVLDEAGSFEERLVTATVDIRSADRSSALRAVGKSPASRQAYGVACEHPEYAAWLQAGLRLVRRLDGT